MSDEKIEFRHYEPEDLKILVPDIEPGWSEVSKFSGPAITAILDGEILMCGGVRIAGIGEAWSAYSEKAKQNYKKILLEVTKDYMKKIVSENQLWRLVASSKNAVSENFLKHLGFVKTHNGLYVNEDVILRK